MAFRRADSKEIPQMVLQSYLQMAQRSRSSLATSVVENPSTAATALYARARERLSESFGLAPSRVPSCIHRVSIVLARACRTQIAVQTHSHAAVDGRRNRHTMLTHEGCSSRKYEVSKWIRRNMANTASAPKSGQTALSRR